MSATNLKTKTKTQSDRRNESEQRLLDALTEIILSDGIRAATSEAIGRRAGYSRGLAIARLGRREEMFALLINNLVNDQMTKFQGLLTQKMSARDKLITYVDVFLDNLENNRGFRAYFVLVAGSVTDRELLGDLVIEATYVVRDLLTAIIEAGIEAGEFSKSVNAEAQAIKIGSSLLGVGVSLNLLGELPMEALRSGAHALIETIQ